jgi:3'-5' exoribonuclease 1
MNFIIVDLEATCWENIRSYDRMEIIEIGATKMPGPDSEPTEEFVEFIKPVAEPILSHFCADLTTIKQSDVDAADSFPIVFRRFLDWIGNDHFFLCSWGQYDQSQFIIDCNRHDIEFPETFHNHINLKREFAKMFSVKSCGMSRALTIAGFSLDGTHHRGIDDARNIAKLARIILPGLPGIAS